MLPGRLVPMLSMVLKPGARCIRCSDSALHTASSQRAVALTAFDKQPSDDDARRSLPRGFAGARQCRRRVSA